MKGWHRSRLTSPARLEALAHSGAVNLRSAKLQTLTLRAVLRLDADASQVNLLDERSQHHIASTPAVAAIEEPASESGCIYVVETAKTVVVPDVDKDRRMTGKPWGQSWKSYIGSPISFEGQVIGSFCVLNSAPRDWLRWEKDFVDELAAQASKIISY